LTPQFIAIKQRILGLLQEEVNKSLGLAMPDTDHQLNFKSPNTAI
jgi:hypothetical protein